MSSLGHPAVTGRVANGDWFAVKGERAAFIRDTFSPLLTEMEEAVRQGTELLRALRMVTIHPAKVLGLQDRLGPIETGKDANFAVFKVVPVTDMGAHVIYTIGEGELKYQAESAL